MSSDCQMRRSFLKPFQVTQDRLETFEPSECLLEYQVSDVAEFKLPESLGRACKVLHNLHKRTKRAHRIPSAHQKSRRGLFFFLISFVI